MNKSIFVQQKLNNRFLLIIATSLLCISYIFSKWFVGVSVIIFIVITTLNYKELHISKLNKFLLIPIIFFLILLVELSYSINLERGLKIVERFLSFLLIPIAFQITRPFNKKEREFIINIFIHSLNIFYFICLLNAIFRQVVFTLTKNGNFNWYFFYRFDFFEIFNQHPTYIAMYTILSISFILLAKIEYIKNKKIRLITIAMYSLGIILAGSRMGYILYFIIISIYIFQKKTQKRISLPKLILLYLSSLLLVAVLLFQIPIIKERIFYTFGIKYDYKYNNKEFVEKELPETQGRLLSWQDAWSLIKEKPFLGQGTGSGNQALFLKYKEKGHDLLLNNKYNAHNSYIQWWLMGGLPLLFCYLFLLGTILVQGIKQKNLVLITFFLIISLTSITETFFKIQGIIFIIFFYCFLINENKHKYEYK